MQWVRRNWLWIVTATAILAGVVLRLHDALLWNPYWGYDGGSHLDYVRILLTQSRLPTLAETYVAWHEPIYYILAAVWMRLGGGFDAVILHLPLLSCMFGLATLALALHWTWQRTRRPAAVAVAALLLAGLPVAVIASTFFSNEGLAQLLMLLAIAIAATAKDPDRLQKSAVIGIVLGIALLTKLTALVAIVAIGVWYLWRAVTSRTWRPVLAGALACTVALAITSPWLVYRTQTFGGLLTNPVEATQPRGGLPTGFFTSLDPTIVSTPFWRPHHQHSFWSMTLGLTVTDYDVILLDQNRTPSVPGTIPSVGGRLLTPWHALLARLAMVLGLCLVPLFILAGWRLLRRVLTAWRRPEGDALLALFLGGSFFALALNIARNGGLDRGNLKTLFILSAVIISVILLADEVTKPSLETASATRRRVRRAIAAYALVVSAAYGAVAVALCWL